MIATSASTVTAVQVTASTNRVQLVLECPVSSTAKAFCYFGVLSGTANTYNGFTVQLSNGIVNSVDIVASGTTLTSVKYGSNANILVAGTAAVTFDATTSASTKRYIQVFINPTLFGLTSAELGEKNTIVGTS